METSDKWQYSFLLELLKREEQKKHEAQYEQLELELELPIDNLPQEIKQPEQEKIERGVIIIDTQ